MRSMLAMTISKKCAIAMKAQGETKRHLAADSMVSKIGCVPCLTSFAAQASARVSRLESIEFDGTTVELVSPGIARVFHQFRR